ncbi:MAG: glutamine synthetase family protein [Christensenellales bacterium]
MAYSASDVLHFISENDVKFVRLAFCDLFGTQKNISVFMAQLQQVFMEGIHADVLPIRGYENIQDSILLLVPDPNTMTVLPWRPQQGMVIRLFCDLKQENGEIADYDTRNVLKKAIRRCTSMGYDSSVGVRCRFYLFKTDENGEPTKTTHDSGGYFDIAPLDKGENVRREICLCLEEMGIKPLSSHHERGPGQHEIDFKDGDPLSAADQFLSFKAVVKAISASNGLFASFMPKPLKDKSGNHLQINFCMSKEGINLFEKTEEGIAGEGESFIAGILNRAPEMTLFLHPLHNSYRLLEDNEEPCRVKFSQTGQNDLTHIIRQDEGESRLVYWGADPSVNPYIAIALLLSAGLEGIQNKERLFEAKEKVLPRNLEDAVHLAENSDFIKDVLGSRILGSFLAAKREELAAIKKINNIEEYYSNFCFKVI